MTKPTRITFDLGGRSVVAACVDCGAREVAGSRGELAPWADDHEARHAELERMTADPGRSAEH